MKSNCCNSPNQEATQRIATLAVTLLVGDVLRKTFSWENTANSFYQVISIDDQTINFRQLNVSKVSEHFGYGLESPIVGDFADDVIITKDKRWLGQFYKWDGQPVFFTYAN